MTIYQINQNTTALIPAKQIGYETRIIEKDNQYVVTNTALEIIETNCREDWASYEIRRDIVSGKTGYIQKVPISVSIKDQRIAMPIHSPQHMDCMWIVLNQHVKLKRNQNKVDLVIKENPYQAITINASVHTIAKQIKRARHVKDLLEK